MNRERVCVDCNGKGGDGVESCKDCQGRGMRTTMTMLGPGMYSQRSGPCDTCDGQGETIKSGGECKKCKGKKVLKDVKVFDIEVPKGAPHGEKIVLFGEGDEIPGVESGDVIVVVDQQPHKIFKRKGGDLMIEKEILLSEALTGVSFTITHLDG